MARPTKKEQEIIRRRNQFIITAVHSGISQTDVAKMFRLPRNTVSTIMGDFKGFDGWLKLQIDRDDPIGDLSGDTERDPDYPGEIESLGELTGYLRARGVDRRVLAAAKEAWQEYESLIEDV